MTDIERIMNLQQKKREKTIKKRHSLPAARRTWAGKGMGLI